MAYLNNFKHLLKNILVAAFTIMAVTFCTFAQTDSRSDTALKAVVKQMTDAQVAYNPATLNKVFTVDYIEISPLGEFDPRAKVLGFYSPEEKAKLGDLSGSVEAVEYSIRNYDNFAIVITRLNYTMTSGARLCRHEAFAQHLSAKKKKVFGELRQPSIRGSEHSRLRQSHNRKI